MKRNTYRNGDMITLPCGCDDCNPAMIQGVLCHESGCEFAWKDYTVSCFECGCDFYPESRPYKGMLCDGCLFDRERGVDDLDRDDDD